MPQSVILRKTEDLLSERRKEMLHSIVSIFPLFNSPTSPAPSTPDTADELTICRCRLPSDLSGDEDELSAALGYVALALTVIAAYYDVPLRYPIVPMGSRSSVRDDVTAPYPLKEYPLYFKGQDSRYPRYAYALLKCNMDQMLQARGIKGQSSKLLLSLQRFIFNETGTAVESKRNSKVGSASSSLTNALNLVAAMSPRRGHARKSSAMS